MNPLTEAREAVAATLRGLFPDLMVYETPPPSVVVPCVIVGADDMERAAFSSWDYTLRVLVLADSQLVPDAYENLEETLCVLLATFPHMVNIEPPAPAIYGDRTYAGTSGTLTTTVAIPTV